MRVGIKNKIVISFLAGVVVSFAFMGWSLFVISGLVSSMNLMQKLTLRMDVTDNLNFQIQNLLKTSGDYLISGDAGKRDSFDALVSSISKNLDILEEANGDERWNSMANRVKTSTMKLSEMTLDIMYTDNPVGNKAAATLMNDASRYGEALMADIEEVNRAVSVDRANLGHEAAGRAKKANLIIYVLPVAGAFVLVFLYYYLRTHITDPLTELYKGAERVAGGDYSSKVEVKTEDELEDLAGGFNRMAEALREREAKMFALLKVIDRVNNELIEAGRHKAAFLSNVSHELKTPLTHILGFSELLKMEHSAGLPESGKKYLDNVNRSGQELLKLIEELLIVARGSGVMMTSEMKDVNA
ncbi:MAG: histidine kinase dimerization/phospho-acceptor domain-containing protein, partial [Thermodesulfobacteriota bacterium]